MLEIVGGKSHSTSKRIMKDLKAPPEDSLRFENKPALRLLHHQAFFFYLFIIIIIIFKEDESRHKTQLAVGRYGRH